MGVRRSCGFCHFTAPQRIMEVLCMGLLVVMVIVALVTGVNSQAEDLMDVAMDERKELDINLAAANETAYKLQNSLLGLATTLTGAGIMEEVYEKSNSPMSVRTQSSQDVANLIADVRNKMQTMLEEKEKAVQELKRAAEDAMKQYGHYKENIDYEDVNYYNAKKVVITNSEFESTENEVRPKIKGTIDYLQTDKTWHFGSENLNLNTNFSTVHVPTNIYDKSNRILHGVSWTENLTEQFRNNSLQSPTLGWQYFCSSDGFFRIYPGMQWPRDPEKVDVFDCRMQKWYIQAASTPKNIIILLDTSGSMTGKRFTIAQTTVSTILDTLSDEDYFNIIKYSKEPEYVDTCFNDTMMPANVDNIRRIQDKIMEIKPESTADLRKALLLAFRLFKEEEMLGGGSICNKAIMIITDGAPENYVDVYNRSNWPEKATRIFTYLIGKEVSDDRKVQWMACVNKGEFTHISTKADVQENVQQYIKVLSRPLAQNKSDHHVWSAVYLDYPTSQSDIITAPMSYMSNHIDAAYEEMAKFEGLGLVISFAMPVFDPRTNKTVDEENPEKNLLGVVGTDVRINDIVKVIPNYQLGVNGYAFAVTNHGYILFHPDFRPFYTTGGKLELRPKYNSVDLSEVELPHGHTATREHPLRQYLLTALEGGHNTTQTVLTHFDGLRRVKLQKNRYQFIAVAETFRLVFVLPDNYGNKMLKVDDRNLPSLEKAFMKIGQTPAASGTKIAPWIYCRDGEGRLVQMDEAVLHDFVSSANSQYKCEHDLVRHLLLDAEETLKYDQIWNGTSFNPGGRGQIYNIVKDQCLSKQMDLPFSQSKCIQEMYTKYGIDLVWIGTASGFTRYRSFVQYVDLDNRYTASIHSLYYRRAVYGWDEGLDYVFYMDGLRDNQQVVMATAEVIGRGKGKLSAPVAVSALRMKHKNFVDLFNKVTADCPGKHKCKVTCKDNDVLNCYLIDNNGYIMASNNNETGGGEFFGKHDPTMMKELLKHHYFFELNVTDYQAMCTSQVSNQDSSSSFIITPFRFIFQVLFWLFAEIGFFVAEWSIRSWFFLRSVTSQGPEADIDPECGKEYPPTVRFFLCNVVIYESDYRSFNSLFTFNNHACVKTATRFSLNTTTVKVKKRFNGSLTDCGQCISSQTMSYTVHWLQNTNLLLIMAAADCQCHTANDTFLTSTHEVQYIFFMVQTMIE
ncbi:voltage-dependent calcium channel subunit alpha-2/delta-3-like [Littorina saxatilis]|uniref:voltage-dependent calcium channel subunit alpha-2/delta-3-like n=1 Tax=Littorina saxatilis TaxID=31220 RepID=UPI0038B45FF2